MPQRASEEQGRNPASGQHSSELLGHDAAGGDLWRHQGEGQPFLNGAPDSDTTRGHSLGAGIYLGTRNGKDILPQSVLFRGAENSRLIVCLLGLPDNTLRLACLKGSKGDSFGRNCKQIVDHNPGPGAVQGERLASNDPAGTTRREDILVFQERNVCCRSELHS